MSGSSISSSAGNPIGNISDFHNQKIMMRDSHLASSAFGMTGSSLSSIPKFKFLYLVKFIRGTNRSSQNIGSNSLDWSNGLGFLVKRIDRPTVEFDTEVLNQYNKKRIIQKNHKFLPINLDFYDTVDNKIFRMFEEYYRYYYGDPQNSTTSAWNHDIVSSFQEGSNGWGFVPPKNISASQTYFFDRMEIYQIYGGQYSQMNLANPKITRFDPDELSFSEGGESCSIGMSLEYEGLVYITNNAPISQNSGLISDLKLQDASFYLPQQDSNSNLSLTQAADYVLRNETSYDPTKIFGSRSIGQSASNTVLPTTEQTFSDQLASHTGGYGAYATEDTYTKIFNGVTTGRLDSMSSHNLGDLASNLGYDFFHTGTMSDIYNKVSNPVLRSNSLLGLIL